MPYTTIPDSWIEAGKPVTQDLMQALRDNCEESRSRLDSLSESTRTAVLINDQIEKPRDSLPVGSIVWGSIDEGHWGIVGSTDYEGEGEWVLCDGRSASDSDWAALVGRANVPDARGRFMRMRDRGAGLDPDGTRSWDHQQTEAYASHSHAGVLGSDTHSHGIVLLGSGLSHSHEVPIAQIPRVNGNSGLRQGFMWGSGSESTQQYYSLGDPLHTDLLTWDSYPSTSTANDTHTHSLSIANAGGAETRPDNITEDCYIKINKAYITKRTRLVVKRIPYRLTVNQILLTAIDQGASGTLEVDIKYGPTPETATTSILSTKPALLHNSTSAIGIPNEANEIEAGEFLVVSITSTQEKMKSFHLFVAGDV